MAASDLQSIRFAASSRLGRIGATYLVTGLNAGANTFAMVYKSNNDGGGGVNTCTYGLRNIVVIPWPN